MTKRVNNWQSLLAEKVEEARNRQYELSVFDCVTWSFEVACALRGTEGPPWKAAYKTVSGGLRVLKRMGHSTLAELVDAEIGPRVSIRLAQRGDMVLLGNGDALGICLGNTVATVTENGLHITRHGHNDIAWRV
jgi:hypothetical protein